MRHDPDDAEPTPRCGECDTEMEPERHELDGRGYVFQYLTLQVLDVGPFPIVHPAPESLAIRAVHEPDVDLALIARPHEVALEQKIHLHLVGKILRRSNGPQRPELV